MTRTFLLTTIAAGGFAFSAPAAVIDFNDPAIQGTAITSVSSDDGTVTASVSAIGGTDQAVVFDTTATRTADPDLQDPFRLTDEAGPGTVRPGGVLIVQERDLSIGGPDDNARGGVLSFVFDQVIDFTGFRIFDGAVVTVSTSSGASAVFSVDEPPNQNYGNRVYGEFSFTGLFDGISDLTFDIRGSGAIDDLQVAAIPVPATLPLLIAGIGGLGFAARRRRKAA